jgi:hypothetical protein
VRGLGGGTPQESSTCAQRAVNGVPHLLLPTVPHLLLPTLPPFLLQRALSAARTAVPHPAITGVIHECVRGRWECRGLSVERAHAGCAARVVTLRTYHFASFSILAHCRCGGKLHMRDRDWDGARLEFMSAFKAFEEAGSGEWRARGAREA